MSDNRRVGSCQRCGARLVERKCPTCDRDVASRAIQREIVVLAVLIAVVVVGFFLTRAAARANHALRMRDAAAWYEAGERALASGRADAGLTALRRATAIDRERREYRFALAGALVASGQDEGARQVLLGIRETRPEDPEINLRLARLERRADNLAGAVRYYQNALYGLWSSEQGDARRQVRIELIDYLRGHNQRARALSELLVLSANLPDEPSWQTRAGQLYLSAGEPRRALEHFARAVERSPRDPGALSGAGEAAFDAGEYVRARRYFRAAPASPRVTEFLAITELVLTSDPLGAGLTFAERRRRLAVVVRHVVESLEACRAADSDRGHVNLDALRTEARSFESTLSSKTARRSPDTIETGVRLMYRIEQQTAQPCAPPSSLDRAVLLIGRRHESDAQ